LERERKGKESLDDGQDCYPQKDERGCHSTRKCLLSLLIILDVEWVCTKSGKRKDAVHSAEIGSFYSFISAFFAGI
jgi:hypothetical protein